MSRFNKPEKDVLTLANGDTLTVRRRLNVGEQYVLFERMSVLLNGERESDPLKVPFARAVVYLIDWSLRDDQGNLVVIRDQPAAIVENALRNLDTDDWREIREALDAHITRQEAARAEEKKLPSGAPASSPT